MYTLSKGICGSSLLASRMLEFGRSRGPGTFGETVLHVANEWKHGRSVDLDLVHLLKAQFYGLGNDGDLDAAVLSIGFERLLLRSRPD